MPDQEFDHDALVTKTNDLLDELDRVGETWHSGKDSTESLRQLRILASGYIQALEQAVSSMGECVNQVLDENERIAYANEEIARASEVMEKLAKGLVKDWAYLRSSSDWDEWVNNRCPCPAPH